MTDTNIKHIGCYITDKKKQQLDWDRFVELAKKNNIIVHDIDLSKFAYPSVQFSLVITKFNYELNAISGDNPDSKCAENLKNFQEFLKKYPEIIQIDPIKCQKKLTTRPKMLKLFHQMATDIQDLYVPESLVLSENDPLPQNFPFPAICKSLEAIGALASHEMCIVWDESGLKQLKRPTLVQQLINHNSTIFKVFIIGEFYYIVKRPSIRNFTPQTGGKTVHFNSQEFTALQGQPTAPLPPPSLINSMIKFLREDSDMSLIGVDIITCNTTGKHFIIDANYFPGYTGVEDCPEKFLGLVLKKLTAKNNK